MIRTTISLREDKYNNLRRIAFAKRATFSGIINARLANSPIDANQDDIVRRIKVTRKLFTKLAGKGKPNIDVVKAIRKMRDERTRQLAKAAGI